MANFHKVSSPYYQTQVEEFYLGEYVPVTIPKSISDITYRIAPKYHLRPDLLANDIYGSSRLWWVIAQCNKDVLIDPIEDFKTGTIILLPSADTVKSVI